MVGREHFFPDGKSPLIPLQLLMMVSHLTPSQADIVVAASQIRMVGWKHLFLYGKSFQKKLQRLVMVS